MRRGGQAAPQAVKSRRASGTPRDRLLFADSTPGALAHALANGWSSGGVLSVEAGALLSAHGMSQDHGSAQLGTAERAVGRRRDRDRPPLPAIFRAARLAAHLRVILQPEALRGWIGPARCHVAPVSEILPSESEAVGHRGQLRGQLFPRRLRRLSIHAPLQNPFDGSTATKQTKATLSSVAFVRGMKYRAVACACAAREPCAGFLTRVRR